MANKLLQGFRDELNDLVSELADELEDYISSKKHADEITIPGEEIRRVAQDILRSYQDGGSLVEAEEIIENFINDSGCNLKIVYED